MSYKRPKPVQFGPPPAQSSEQAQPVNVVVAVAAVAAVAVAEKPKAADAPQAKGNLLQPPPRSVAA